MLKKIVKFLSISIYSYSPIIYTFIPLYRVLYIMALYSMLLYMVFLSSEFIIVCADMLLYSYIMPFAVRALVCDLAAVLMG